MNIQRRHTLVEAAEDTRASDKIGSGLDGKLHGEACQVVALEEIRVAGAFHNITGIDGGQRVVLAGVATNGQEFRVHGRGSNGVQVESGNGILVTDGTLIPVIGEALVGRVSSKDK